MRHHSKIAGLLVVALFLLLTRGLLLGFLEDKRTVIGGIRGDQVMYLWALERAQRVHSLDEYLRLCDFSDRGCLDMTSEPQEWKTMYVLGKLGAAVGLDATATLFALYYAFLLLNCVAAFFFITTISGSPWMAAAFACGIGLQESLLLRTTGHLMLVAVWPLLFCLAFQWRLLRGEWRNAIPFWIFIFLTAQFSFYYAAFGAFLVTLLTLAFVMANGWPYDPRWKKLVPATAVVVALSFLPIRYAHFGGPGGKNTVTFYRPLPLVYQYSAYWRDYVKQNPRATAAPWASKVGLVLTREERHHRGEQWAFVGVANVFFGALTLLLGLVYAAAAAIKRQGLTREAKLALTLVGLMLVTGYLGTYYGGCIIHVFFPSLRGFSRLAPFAMAFGAAGFAAFWRARGPFHWLVSLALFVAIALELRATPLLAKTQLKLDTELAALAAKLRDECAKGRYLWLTPRDRDWLSGPQRVMYLAELSGCRVDGIDGPGLMPNKSPVAASGVPIPIIWSKRNRQLAHLYRKHADATRTRRR